MANAHKRQNLIRKMKINEVWSTDQRTLKQDIANAFQSLLSNPGDWKASPNGLVFSKISEVDAQALELPFSDNEMLSALHDMDGDKAPGPDGFIVAFWQSYWDIVKLEVMRLFRGFHDLGKFVRSLNTTFLVLIPKIKGAKDFKDFKPISLMGSLYKLIVKVLENRLKRVMSGLVNKA